MVWVGDEAGTDWEVMSRMEVLAWVRHWFLWFTDGLLGGLG